MHPSQLQIKDFSYHLPNDRIAKYPLSERDMSKLLIYENQTITEDIYRNIGNHLEKDSLLLFNNTLVIEARILFEKSAGSSIEVFCLEPAADLELTQAMMSKSTVQWNCLVGGASKWKQTFLEKKISSSGQEFNLRAKQIDKKTDSFVIEFNWDNSDLTFAEVLHHAGVLPLPPYLQRKTEPVDYERYQTVYARNQGSVAAPTAGLHFTNSLLNQLKQKGIEQEYVTLHVGAGTFKPVKSSSMQEHEMHKEWILVKISAIETIFNALEKNIIPVGTTSLRTLETLYWMGVKALVSPNASLLELEIKQWDVYDLVLQTASAKQAFEALLNLMQKQNLQEIICYTQILIAPGYKIRVADALISNFHQPNSTLLLLIAAFIGDDWRKVYDYALTHDFRFLSYGDGCLLWFNRKNL
jgi:S-adenosylmethionine:tRNA ribosyltransferase-isomerase